MSPSTARAIRSVLLCALLLAGCARQRPGPDVAAVQARCQVLIDAGNSLYRAKDYADAAKRYGAAVVVKPDDAAAYFGLGMALAKLGRDEDARAAYARARELAQQAREGTAGDSAR